MNTTPSEQWIARKLESAAAAIPLPHESRWIPAEPSRSVPALAFALVAVVIALAIATYFTLPGTRVVPAQQPTEPRSGTITNVGTVTLDETTCSFRGPTTFAAGRIVIDVVNRSELTANVFLRELQGTYTFAEMADHVDRQRERIAAGLRAGVTEPLLPPVWAATMGEAWNVAPGSRGEIATLVWPATHVIECGWVDLRLPLGERLKAVDLIGPLQVVR